MGRMTTWLLAFAVVCAPVLAPFAGAAAGQVRSGNADQAPAKKGKDTPQPAADRPGEERDRWKWWLYDRAELGITDAQSAAINDIFETTIPRLREARQDLERAEQDLSRTIKEHKADIAFVSLQLDRVESARSHHNKMRSLMLYRIHALLSEEQRVKLEAVRARQNAKRGERPSPSDRAR